MQSPQPEAQTARTKGNKTVLPVFLVTAALFTSVASLLGVQVASGRDPLLGSKVAAVTPRKVLLRKLVVTRKVTTLVDAPTAAAGGQGGGPAYASAGSGSGSSYSAPTQSYSAPVQSAPAPVQTATSGAP
ncbi:MAG: hypothetical protein WCK97_05575 [Actinomycetes bacterium]